MMSLFLFYKDDQQLALNAVIENLNHDLIKMGVMVRTVDFKDYSWGFSDLSEDRPVPRPIGATRFGRSNLSL